MPTEPLKLILDPDANIAQQRPLLDIACPLLRELVNNGTHVFRRCEATSTFDAYETLPPLLLYYHILEMADGIEVLLSNACTNAAIPQLRTCFETYLQLKYMLASDHRRRTLQWIVCDIHADIAGMERWDPTTTGGAQRWETLNKEQPDLVNDSKVAECLPQQREVVEEMLRSLQKPDFVPIEAEYQLMKMKSRSAFEWYEMFDGPPNRRELASRITIDGETQRSMYDLLYGDWSGRAHGTRLRHFYTAGEEGRIAFFAFRQPHRLKDTAVWIVNFLVDATNCVVSRFRPGEELAHWYLREVRPLFSRLLDLKVEIN